MDVSCELLSVQPSKRQSWRYYFYHRLNAEFQSILNLSFVHFVTEICPKTIQAVIKCNSAFSQSLLAGKNASKHKELVFDSKVDNYKINCDVDVSQIL